MGVQPGGLAKVSRQTLAFRGFSGWDLWVRVLEKRKQRTGRALEIDIVAS